uniref:Ran-specific GTPase-activating protein n=1 Tax=Sciurus vulgaris TaxID=55149 RepID=A0A8D2D5Q9_SCIVU
MEETINQIKNSVESITKKLDHLGDRTSDNEDKDRDTSTENADESNHDPQFEPIVLLLEQEIKMPEEDEEELFKIRAKLFRFASENHLPEGKEQGTGDVKLLKHKEKGTIGLLMRRDKTLKICTSHYITPKMELKPNAGRDQYPKSELLSIHFLNSEDAQKFKAKFEECRKAIEEREEKVGLGKKMIMLKNDNE